MATGYFIRHYHRDGAVRRHFEVLGSIDRVWEQTKRELDWCETIELERVDHRRTLQHVRTYTAS